MKLRTPQLAALVIVVGLVAGLATVTLAVTNPAGTDAVPAVVTPQMSFAGLAAATGEPELVGMAQAQPSRGEIVQVAGPFDDRFSLEDLAFDGASVTGAVRVTSDVSEVIDLQVLAGFYDEQGNLLGTDRFVHHLGSTDPSHAHETAPDERMIFRIEVPAVLAGQAVGVALGVPVLVNE
ncbi:MULTISPECIES: hypothetical protein [Cryobacterium]|uniref:DUF4352 domain-containing protein n=1 Tax=Cryobacterium breve TaxID=1259258 RepID=A0ABY2IXW6_9MICO|nr:MULTISPECIES: hypothetical protein [Cryobacterium]TFC96165.1 hypothetical protein E3O65_14120 [Cryobacterium breve]TFC98065.1 hypothetical protein E3T20_00210 [Cryobacterium sp. TmT3-12]